MAYHWMGKRQSKTHKKLNANEMVSLNGWFCAIKRPTITFEMMQQTNERRRRR